MNRTRSTGFHEGVGGVLVGAIASAPVALALTLTTTEFVAELAVSADESA